MNPETPIFDLQDHFDATVSIGAKVLPVHIKRFSRSEQEAFEKKWRALVTTRGTAELTEEQREERSAQQLQFFEDTIREAITLDEGLVKDRGKWVTDGAGLIAIFHARKDVLGEFLAQIWVKNRLIDIERKNSSSPQDSGTGSAPSSQARGGDAPESTVPSAERLTTAASDSAMASTEGPEPETDGTKPDRESSGAKVH